MLHAKYDAEQIKTLAQSHSSATKGSAKKKTKKKPSALPVSAPITLDSILKDSFSGKSFIFPRQPSTSTLVSPVWEFQQLICVWPSKKASDSQKTLLLSTTVRVIEAASKVLSTVLDSQIPQKSQVDVLQTLSSLIHHVLATFLTLVKRKPKDADDCPDPLDIVVDVLTRSVLQPTILSFGPLSERLLTSIFRNTSSNIPVDLRPTLLALFRNAFSAINPRVAGLEECIAMEAIRELCKSYPGVDIEWPDLSQARIHRMARKDTLWYLCAVLHILFGSEVGGGRAAGLVEKGILKAFSELISPFRRSITSEPEFQVLDEVEQGMILSVVEKYML
ncbi:hypothetical protein C8J56DRAFT_856757 [Mycena floridula]|nr:hypothetical protein C8J56DRAFT_856757 [Mycena floridula]